MVVFEHFNLWTLWVLLALDVVTSLSALRLGAKEGNPVMAWLMGIVGPAPSLVGTHVVAGAISFRWGAEIGPHGLWGLSAYFASVVLWNVATILRLRK
jgi:hypothetical protein